jgi:hypothetical protein
MMIRWIFFVHSFTLPLYLAFDPHSGSVTFVGRSALHGFGLQLKDLTHGFEVSRSY